MVSGALTLDAQPAAEQTLTVAGGRAGGRDLERDRWAQGDTANLRFWVHTTDEAGADYLEDAVASTLPVKPFAAPEAVATSGEVAARSADENVFMPYSVNPLLGELVIQVSPSLAAATTDSINYVKEYDYESTDQTVSRFLPLVVLEKVYNEQGLKTPYAARHARHRAEAACSVCATCSSPTAAGPGGSAARPTGSRPPMWCRAGGAREAGGYGVHRAICYSRGIKRSAQLHAGQQQPGPRRDLPPEYARLQPLCARVRYAAQATT